MICIRAVDLGSVGWLGSELAGHISRYGVWLKGPGDWRRQTSVGQEAANQKERRLVSLVRSVKHSWTKLHPAFQLKYCVTIRRELQRLLLLRAAVPIPPTPLLDSEWLTRKPGQNPFISISAPIFDDTDEFTLRNVLA